MTMMPFDHATMKEAFSAPGMDPRQWVSYGIVQPNADGQYSVRFNDEQGNPLPEGVMVDVQLEPSGIVVPARVLMRHAGSGEGSFSPIGPGDEVLCAIPEGHEGAGVVILGKLSNSRDVFPTTVAGQDTTQNNVVFDRHVCPYILESASSLMFRVGNTGQQLAFDPTGNVFMSSGDGHMLSLTADVLSFQTKDGAASVQINPEKDQVGIQADGTSFLFDNATSLFQTGGTLGIGTGGLAPTGHAVTLEQVVNLFVNFVYFLNSCGGTIATALAGATGPLFPATFPANFITLLTAWLQGGASPAPPTVATPGGNLTAMGLGPLIAGVLLTQLPDPAGLAPAPTFIPGIGKQSLMF